MEQGLMFTRFAALLTMACMISGCGGAGSEFDLNKVQGKITMDGKPVVGARVLYTPKGGGRPAFGLTDGSGYYSVQFTSAGEGAEPGEYVVSVTTFRAPEEDVDTGKMTETVPETIPVVYVRNSQLSATVPGGTYDFDLKSDAGEIVQPKIMAE